MQYPMCQLLHSDFPAARSVSLRVTASNARPTSTDKAANSTASTDFLGLITTSTRARSSNSTRLRTASRIRRLIRFRWTAPPNARPTVMPTRGPGDPSFRSAGVSKKNTVKFPENCRLPFSYTRLKSACFNKRTDFGNLATWGGCVAAQSFGAARQATPEFELIRGIPVSRTRVCGPLRDGETKRPARSWFSFGYGNRASSRDGDGSVGKCASACEYCAPNSAN
jgi:hypothetical protein